MTRQKRKSTKVDGAMIYRIRQLRSEGMNYDDIARVLGCSATTAHRYVKGAFKDVIPPDYPDTDPSQINLTSEAANLLHSLKTEKGIKANDAITRGLWLLLDSLTEPEPEPEKHGFVLTSPPGTVHEDAPKRVSLWARITTFLTSTHEV